MLTRVLFTTALLFTSLPNILVSAATSRKNTDVAIKPQIPNDMCPWIAPPAYSFFNQQCSLAEVTIPSIKPIEEILSTTITGFNATETKKISDGIMQIRNIHPNIKDYVDLVLNHLPTFIITKISNHDADSFLASLNYPGTAGAPAAFYLPDEIELQLTEDFFHKEKQDAFLITLRHELRHAAMNTVHRILKSASPFSTEIYYPNTELEKTKIQDMVDAGKERLIELNTLLHLEQNKSYNNKPLTKKQKNNLKKLAQLRKKYQDNYNEYYRNSIIIEFSKEQFERLERHLGDTLIPGGTYHINPDNSGMLLGLCEVAQIERVLNKNKKPTVKVHLLMNDPLIAFKHHTLTKNHTVQSYPPEDRLSEMDAYLNEYASQALIAEYFTELHNHTNNLFRQAKSAAPLNNQDNATKQINRKTRRINDLITEINNPSFFMPQNMQSYINYSYKSFNNGNYDIAEKAMKTLIHNNLALDQANFILGMCAYNQNKFALAVQYFQSAEKNNYKFTPQTRHIYAEAQKKSQLKQQATTSASATNMRRNKP